MGWVRRALDLVSHSSRFLSGDPWKRAGLSDWILDVDTDRKYSDQTTIYVDQLLGDDADDGNIARPMQTLGEALRSVWARRQTGDITELVVILIGRTGVDGVDLPITYTWPSGYDDMRAVTFQGVGRLVSLAGQDVASTVNDRSSRSAGQTATLTVNPGWTPNVSIRDGYFAQNDSADGDWRAVAGATSSNTFRYSGGNYGSTLTPVAVATDDITIFKPGTQIDFDTIIAGSWRRVEWADVDFQRMDLVAPGSATRGIIIHNGPTFVRGSTCKFRVSAGEYGELEFERAFYRPSGNANFTDFGRMAIRGTVFRGDAGGFFSFGTGQCTFDNYNVFTDWAQGQLRFTGHASVGAANWGTLHLDNSGGFESTNAKVESYGPLRILGTLAAGTVNLLEINNGSVWAWDSASDVMQSNDVTRAEVSVDNGATATSADVATQTFVPGWTDFNADYTTSFTAVTGIS